MRFPDDPFGVQGNRLTETTLSQNGFFGDRNTVPGPQGRTPSHPSIGKVAAIAQAKMAALATAATIGSLVFSNTQRLIRP